MKKYLMLAVAGLAIASCSKMDDYATSPAEIVQAKYNQAFFKYVDGKIDPNHTWGFGDDVYSNAPAFDFTRSVTGITFPTFKDGQCPSMPTQYSNTVPTDAIYAKTYAEQHPHDKFPEGAVIYINEAYPQFWGENQVGNVDNLIIYVDGNITLNESFSQNQKGTTLCVTQGSTLKLNNVRENLTVYLAPNAKLDLSECQTYVWHQETNSGGNESGAVFTKGTAALYMSAGSKVEGGAIYFKDDYTVLNEGGTIDVGELHVENGAILYNKNKVKATGVIALRNTNGEIDNFGTMEGASMTLDANARFYNVTGGTVTISGLTKLNNDSGNNAWMNGGQFNTGSFEITGGCQDPAAFNNCHMTVTGKFFMNHGNFVLDGGAAVECGSFEWNSDNYFHMGGKALLKVSGDMLMKNQNSSPNYGFWGDDAEYAVIQANSISKETEGQYRSAYYGNLFIDTNNHFEQGGTDAQPWYYFGSSVKFSFNDNSTSTVKKATKATDFTINIPADQQGCTPGYKYTPSNPPTTPPTDDNSIRIIAEDLSAAGDTDFDFNDVVLDVTFGNPAKVVLTHAGGTLPLRINGNDANEVHKLFGVWQGDDAIDENTPLQQMVNTGKGPSKPSVDLTNVLNVSISSRSEADTNLKLEVYKNGSWIEMKSDKGEPACKLAVGQDFTVLGERQSIKRAYPNFLSWVENEKFSSQWW